MTVLAIDTAADRCAACLWDPAAGRSIASRSMELSRGHAENILPLIDEVLGEAGCELDVVEKIGVCVGPGSFTGIRVGVSVARGFGVALKVPVVGISVFAGLNAEVQQRLSPKSDYAIAILGGRNQAFIQWFAANGYPQTEPSMKKLDDEIDLREFSGSIVYGNACEQLGAPNASPDLSVGTAGIKTYASLISDCEYPPKPLYIRVADAKVNANFALPRSKGTDA